MKLLKSILISIILSIIAISVNARNGSGKPLFDYVQSYDPHYNWDLKATYKLNNATYHVLSLGMFFSFFFFLLINIYIVNF